VAGWLTFKGAMPLLAPAVPLALLVIAFKASQGVRIGVEDRAGMTKAIEGTLAIHTIGSLWLAACVLRSSFTRSARYGWPLAFCTCTGGADS